MRPSKTWTTLLMLAGLCAVPYLAPPLSAYRLVRLGEVARALGAPFRPGHVARAFRPTASPTPSPTPGPRPAPAASPTPQASASPAVELFSGRDWPKADTAEEARGVEDATGSLVHFYEALARVEAGRGIARVSHFGDSPVTGDMITSDARRKLQARFGDAGPGWIFPDRPWEWYGHRGVELRASGWEIVSPLPPRSGRGPSGLGGVRFEGRDQETRSRIVTGKHAPVGRFEIHYLARPDGGTLLASVDGGEPRRVSTAEGTGASVQVLPVDDGPHALTLRPEGDGLVALFGVVLERDRPGVVYDSLGAIGVTVGHLARLDGTSWVKGLSLRRPDLVVLNFGTNESGYGFLPFSEYARYYERLVTRIRTALPECGVLVMAPMDRAYGDESGRLVTMPSIPRLVAGQRLIAERAGVAFFNTYAAMGGRGTMVRWYEAEPRLATGDFTHPTALGADLVGELLVTALLDGYRAWRESHAPSPSPEAPPSPSPSPSVQAGSGADVQQDRSPAQAGTESRQHRPLAGA